MNRHKMPNIMKFKENHNFNSLRHVGLKSSEKERLLKLEDKFMEMKKNPEELHDYISLRLKHVNQYAKIVSELKDLTQDERKIVEEVKAMIKRERNAIDRLKYKSADELSLILSLELAEDKIKYLLLELK